MLNTTRNEWDAAAARLAPLPARITSAGGRLLDIRQSDPATGTAAGQWQRAAEQLDLMAVSLASAVAALASYTGGLSGADPATT